MSTTTEDMNMDVTIKSFCPRCGFKMQVTSRNLLPRPDFFRDTMERMQKAIEKTHCPKCAENTPQIGNEWVGVWTE
jgi:NMD protein affecting ribosome stability and mRNA decay